MFTLKERSWRNISATLLVLLLAACGPGEPVKLGFLGGLSGPISDLGEAGRDAVLLAVEQANAAGGVNGRKVELLIHDDGQQAEQAVKGVEILAAAGVEVVIGPMTSAMGAAVMPAIKRLGVVMISPTITARPLSGGDDTMFKLAPGMGELTQPMARYLYAQGSRRVAVIYDLKNRAFSVDWLESLRSDFTALGGALVADVPFSSGDFSNYGQVAEALAVARPDAIHFVASALDTVRLVQAVRQRGLEQPVSAASWAATESLIQLGGRLVEGMVLIQFFNRDDLSPRYLAFREAYQKRFRQDPGFASVAAYDAARAALDVLARRQRGQSVKAALLAFGPYDGVQERWIFDPNGDARRKTYMARVRNSSFVIID